MGKRRISDLSTAKWLKNNVLERIFTEEEKLLGLVSITTLADQLAFLKSHKLLILNHAISKPTQLANHEPRCTAK